MVLVFLLWIAPEYTIILLLLSLPSIPEMVSISAVLWYQPNISRQKLSHGYLAKIGAFGCLSFGSNSGVLFLPPNFISGQPSGPTDIYKQDPLSWVRAKTVITDVPNLSVKHFGH